MSKPPRRPSNFQRNITLRDGTWIARLAIANGQQQMPGWIMPGR
jgi:hypothetical protein